MSNMVFDKIGKGGGGEKARLAWLARTILVAYVEPKRFFFILLAGNSPVQPLVAADVDVAAGVAVEAQAKADSQTKLRWIRSLGFRPTSTTPRRNTLSSLQPRR